MKKTIIALSLIGLFMAPVIILAADITLPTEAETFEDTGDLIAKIDDIGNLIFAGLLGLAAIFLVVAGYFFVTAGGNPEGINKARQMLINALIGVAVGLSARGLIAVITNFIKE